MTIEDKFNNIPVGDNLFTKLSDEEIQYNKLMGSIAGQLYLERIKRNMSQKEFAEMLNVKQSLISRWESGGNNFTFHQVAKIFSKLGLKVDISFMINCDYESNEVNTCKFERIRRANLSKRNIEYESYLLDNLPDKVGVAS